jgi:gas vesicle protein
MQDKKNPNTIKGRLSLTLGLLAGGAIGAAIGMLFSPHSGTVNRRNIRRKGEAIADDVKETIEDRIDLISNTVSEKVDKLKDGLKSTFGSVQDEFTNH